MEAVVAAAEAAGLPADYRRELELWLPHQRLQAEQPVPQTPKVRPLFSAPSSVRRSRN
jgi:hypothetical protein